jgi:hypothetical protein
MMEPGHQQGFPLEAVAEFFVGRDVIVHDLDNHISTEVELSSQVDAAHAPLTEEPLRLVPAQKNSTDHG